LETLRALLIQRAARLQGVPAVTFDAWGPLPYPAFRNRVEGVALGIMADQPPLGKRIHAPGGGPWAWAGEVAAACCGLVWDPSGTPIDPGILGGPRFNDEEGRQHYHDRDHDLEPGTLFSGSLDHGELLTRLRRLNGRLGWDHATTVTLPLDRLETPEVRAALWSVLYGGSHAILISGAVRDWNPASFKGMLE